MYLMRQQYIREKCGACGKKMAYVNVQHLSSGNFYDVRCMSCKTTRFFTQFHVQNGTPVWPGTLAAAALMLLVETPSQ